MVGARMSVRCSGEEVEFEDGSLQMSSVLLIRLLYGSNGIDLTVIILCRIIVEANQLKSYDTKTKKKENT